MADYSLACIGFRDPRRHIGQRLTGACSTASLCSSCPLVGVSRAAIHRSHLCVSAPGQTGVTTESSPLPMNCSNLKVVSGGTLLARYHMLDVLRGPHHRPRRARFEMRSPVGPVACMSRHCELVVTPKLVSKEPSDSEAFGRAANQLRREDAPRSVGMGGCMRVLAWVHGTGRPKRTQLRNSCQRESERERAFPKGGGGTHHGWHV